MNYKQKYEEALEKAKAYHYHTHDVKEVLEIVFPEIAESKDERIRKWIIKYLQYWADNAFDKDESNNCKNAIAWLEKQKPTLNKGDEEYLTNAIYACLHQYGKDSDTAKWLKSLVEQL